MQNWTTDAVAAREQFSYWRDVLCEAFVSLNPVRMGSTSGFHGSVRSRALGATTQTVICASPQQTNRRLEEIRRNPVEFCFANFQQQGTCLVRQDGRETLVQPNDFYVVDTTRPYFLEYGSSWRVLSFRVPRHQLSRRLGELRHATARRITGASGVGLVATQFAQSLDTLDETVALDAQEGLSHALADVLAAALGANHAEHDPASLRSAARQAIERYIDEHLADPSLSPEGIAARFRMSRRYVYSLFEAQPQSVGGVIRARRLERCARELLLSERPSVFDVALKWGFNDPAHFSRLFKRQYGVPPRLYARSASHPAHA